MRAMLRSMLAVAALLGAASLVHADECWLQSPPGYQGIGGASRLGPYPDWYAANRVNQEYFNGQGTISCRRTNGDPPPEQFRYGAAKFHNRTSLRLTFSVRTSPGGSWQQATVESGSWYWFWKECPCRFHCTWDGSLASGNQAVTQEVTWYGYADKPTDAGARDWQFVQRGSAIRLVGGADEPVPAAAPAPGPRDTPGLSNTVSFVGSGEGMADALDFRSAKSADGMWSLSFLPRVRGLIPALNGRWHLQWLRIEGDRDDPLRIEVWNLSLSGFHGPGWRDQTADLRIVGGVGTASFFSTQVPGNEAAGTIRLKVDVQFHGQIVRLGFTRAY